MRFNVFSVQSIVSLATVVSVVNSASLRLASGGGGEEPSAPAEEGTRYFTYGSGSSGCDGSAENKCAPSKWYNLPSSSECKSTSTSIQSPIDFSNIEADASLPNPEFVVTHDGCDAWTQGPTDHSFEISFSQSACTDLNVVYDHVSYRFLTMHFHSPSEHTIGGAHFSGEAHMVHKSSVADGNKLLVISVLLQEKTDAFTPNNTFLDSIWHGKTLSYLSESHSVHDTDVVLNPYTSFTPGSKVYYAYEGSMTTPPCRSDHVHRLVYAEPVGISSDDIHILRDATAHYHGEEGSALDSHGNFNRPVQELNGRTVHMSTGMDVEEESEDSVSFEAKAAVVVASIALAVVGMIVVVAAFAALICCGKDFSKGDNKAADPHAHQPVGTGDVSKGEHAHTAAHHHGAPGHTLAHVHSTREVTPNV